MFKTDKESLEKLSFEFNERDIALIGRLLESLKKYGISTLSDKEHKRLQSGLKKIGALKLNGKYYAFHIEDEFAYRQGDTNGYGVEVHLRQGNKLVPFIQVYSREYVFKVDEVAEKLRKNKIKTVYTGEIPHSSDFLGLSHENDVDEDPLTISSLSQGEIEDFKAEGIEVIVLERLI
jgi:hypothetical protein